MFGRLSDNTLDFDLMGELLYDGYWLQTTDGSDFWQPGLPASSALNFTSYCLPTAETRMDHMNPNPHQKSHQEGRERLDFGDNPPLVYPQMDELVGSQTQNQEVILAAASSGQSENLLVEGTETSRRLWIAPSANLCPSFSVKKRLVQAIEYLRESTRDRDVLIQIWVSIKRGGKKVLTTKNQPFSLGPNCKSSLADYRDVSRSYQFAAEENSKDFVGLPGRVFLNKLPEWTPDVRFFTREEYARVSYAQQYNVRGSLALPVFKRGSRTCLAVVEIVTSTQKAHYRPEIDYVCKALEAVDLRSSEILSPRTVKACDDDSFQAALTEIQEVLKSVCDSHGLPLAQTWAPCIQQGKAGCRHSDENHALCVSTVGSACYVPNPQVLGFHEACCEHHLLRGEGVAGGAFMTNQPRFATDITAFSKTEYPLSHHARMFGLRASVAIRLRSIYTGLADFVLEFFLPFECRQDPEEQMHMLLSSLSSSVIQQVCQSLRVVTDQELVEETAASTAVFPGRQTVSSLGGRLLGQGNSQKLVSSLSKETFREESSWNIAHVMAAQRKGKAVAVSLGYQKEEPEEGHIRLRTPHKEVFSRHMQIHGPKGSAESSGGDFSSVSEHLPSSGASKPGEKRRTKTEKTINLQILQQYFAGSLKDAAKCIGVCPTTLKRICRQHGITRWPSRKIKKVGHSLRKLQLVIDSVQGVQGAIQLSSFYSNFPELSTSNLPGSASKMNDQLNHYFNTQSHDEGSLLSPTVTTTSKYTSFSSGSQSSGSSFISCSRRAKQPPATLHALGGGGDANSFAEQAFGGGGALKRARSSVAELYVSGQEETKLLEALPPLPIRPGVQVLRDRRSIFKVKATFGEAKIRFSMQQNWGFGDLLREVVRRFSMTDDNNTSSSSCSSGIDLKYLDDDSEWVLLTCDADLEECIDVYTSSGSRTIKLTVHQLAFHSKIGSSLNGRSSGPFL